jgi:hypothetical protein
MFPPSFLEINLFDLDPLMVTATFCSSPDPRWR